MKLDNKTLRSAIKLWCTDKNSAIYKYGHISSWDVSNVTDMSKLFFDMYGYMAREFNENINNWNKGNVTNMEYIFSNAYDFNQPHILFIGDIFNE